MLFADLEGKICLVTGSSRGIGAAVARGLGRNRAKVAVHYRTGSREAEAVVRDIEQAGGTACALASDLGERGAAAGLVERTVEAFGGLDVLINNAGDLLERRPVVETTDSLFDQHVALNMHPVFDACRAAIPHLRAQGGGSIVNTASIAARTGGDGGSALYAGAKAFTAALTRALAKEVARDNVRVNAVAPGVIETALLVRTTPERSIDAAVRQIPLRRLGTAEECVGAFLLLCSDQASSYVTGQIIEVNGGMAIG